MNLSNKTNYVHLFFISFLAVHYVIPLIFIGQVVINIHDNLDIGVVYDHIISKIYKGDVESISYFLSGEIKWYYLQKLFYPTNILHYVLNDEFFYFTNDILKKLLPYFSFYLLAKSLKITKFNSALGGILYSTIINIHTPFGFGLPLLPYILYLLINKNSLDKKHYLALFLIGLNSSLVQNIFVFILLLPLSLVLRKKNFILNIYIKVFSVIIIAIILSSLHLIIGSLSEIPIHRVDFVLRQDLIFSFIDSLKGVFFGLEFNNFIFIFKIPLIILFAILLTTSFFSRQKNMKLIFYFIIFILFLQSIFGSNLIDNFFIGALNILKGFNFARVDKILPLAFALLFIFYISILKNKNLKKFLYVLSFFSVISVQLMTPLPEIGQYFLKNNMQLNKFRETKKSILENNYTQAFKIIFNVKNYTNNEIGFNYITNKTFDSYYKFEDYTFIKNIVEDSRVMSIGLDPMIAVMNDIRVIDGYHTIYPLNYKIKFRKIIERVLENDIKLKNYYDNWGNRVYAFYNDEKNLMLNFQYAKKLGADYVISKFPIDNNELKIICYKCNDSSQIFLYIIL